MLYFLLSLGGIAIGAVASLLGIGGGIFITPLLLLSGLVATAQEAAGTSIVAVMANGLASTIAYGRRGVTNWKVGLALVPGAVAGGWLGPWIGREIASSTLALAFGIFLLYPATVLLRGKQPKDLFRGGGKSGVGVLAGLGIGLVAGTAGGLFGIGGGVIMVPALTFLGLDIVTAAATSLFVMVPSGAVSTLRHALAGNTHWDLAFALIAGVLVGSQIGPVLSSRLPAPWIRRLFALVLVYVSVNMILRGLS